MSWLGGARRAELGEQCRDAPWRVWEMGEIGEILAVQLFSCTRAKRQEILVGAGLATIVGAGLATIVGAGLAINLACRR